MTAITIARPIAAVTAAAMQAELTHWLVAPTTIGCPECSNMGPYRRSGQWIDCPACGGWGRVPLVVDVGDRVTGRISDELPEMGQRIGAWTAYINPPDLRLIPQSSTVRRWLRLHPGGSLSGTVAAIPDTTTAALPIVECSDRIAHICRNAIGDLLRHTPLTKPDENGETEHDITDELVWQDFPPGMQAFRLTDVTVTP